MPILVTCPTCAAKLNAPDSAAGKAVRCPKAGCGTVVPVAALIAAAEEPVEAKAVAPPRPPVKAAPVDDDEDERPRSRRRRDDEDDDDDEDERPRKRSRRDEDDEDERPRSRRRRDDEDDDDEDERPRRRSRPGQARRRRGGGGGGGKTAVVVVAIVVGLAVLGGVGYGVYRLVGGGGPTTPPPVGWKEYTYANDNFKAFFPKEPQVSSHDNMMGMGGGGPMGEPFGGGMPAGKIFLTHYVAGDFSDPVFVQVGVVRVPSGIPSQQRNAMLDGVEKIPGGMKQFGVETRSVRWLGEKAVEIVTPGVTMRMAVVGDRVYQAQISGANGTRAKPETETAFFDNIRLLK